MNIEIKTCYITVNFPNGKIIKRDMRLIWGDLRYRQQILNLGVDFFYSYEEALNHCEQIRQKEIERYSNRIKELLNMKIE